MNHSKDTYIHVNGEWALQADQYCVTLFKKRVAGKKAKNAGQLQIDPVGYFGNYEHALQRLVDMDVQPINHIDYMVERISELKKDITKLIKSGALVPQDAHRSEKGEK